MSSKKKKDNDSNLPLYISKPHVIIYDDTNIKYIVGNGVSFEWEPDFMTYSGLGERKTTTASMGVSATIDIDDAECLDNIKLDETLMRRIAEFNKSQECKRLDKEIHDKRQEIAEIEAVLEDREGRLAKLKEFIRHIYEIELDDWDE